MEPSKSNELFRKEQITESNNQVSYNIYKGDMLVAEVRGLQADDQKIIPMRELSDYDESKLQEYVGKIKNPLS